MAVALGLALVLHILIGGAIGPRWDALGAALLAGPSGELELSTVLWQLRLPRALACVAVGGILGLAGAAFQLLFRNPLAEPFVIGVSGGAGVGGTLVVLLGVTGLGMELGVLGGAMVGALLTLSLVLALQRRGTGLRSDSLLLSGVVIGTVLMGLMNLLLLSSGRDSSQVVRWMLGSMTPMFWSRVAVLFVALALGLIVLWRESRALNALSFGEATAYSLGVDPKRTGQRVLLAGTAISGLAVGASGILGFLGMIAPNAVRWLAGPDARVSLPLSAAAGAILLLAADLLAQQILPGLELPVGAVLAVLGAPALLILLRKKPL